MPQIMPDRECTPALPPLYPLQQVLKALLDEGFLHDHEGLFRWRSGKHSCGHIDVVPRRRGVELATIFTEDRWRKHGIGTTMLQAFCRAADRLQVPVILTATPIGSSGPGKRELTRWYGRAGFVALDAGPGEGGTKMLRRPISPELCFPQAPPAPSHRENGPELQL